MRRGLLLVVPAHDKQRQETRKPARGRILLSTTMAAAGPNPSIPLDSIAEDNFPMAEVMKLRAEVMIRTAQRLKEHWTHAAA